MAESENTPGSPSIPRLQAPKKGKFFSKAAMTTWTKGACQTSLRTPSPLRIKTLTGKVSNRSTKTSPLKAEARRTASSKA